MSTYTPFKDLDSESSATSSSSEITNETQVNEISISPLLEFQLQNLQHLRDVADFYAETNKILLDVPKKLQNLKDMARKEKENFMQTTGTDSDIGRKIENLLALEVEYRSMKVSNEALRDAVEKMKGVKEGEEWVNREGESARMMRLLGEESKRHMVDEGRGSDSKFINDWNFCIIS